jgi:hypothetical protein
VAFGYEYLMVYLPEFNPDSFLLFVHNPAGATKLRDYSSGRERVLGQPPLSTVSRATLYGKSRFTETAHTVSGQDGNQYWSARTSEYNLRFLPSIRNGAAAEISPSVPMRSAVRTPAEVHGRARRGSQRQLQDYVNEHQPVLTNALLEALPERLREAVTSVRWVSPLAGEDYVEYRDGDFLEAVGLGEFSSDLAVFWPSSGPSWDALAVLTTSFARSRPVVVLVEAKSHVPEIYGNGCQAGPASRSLIEKSLAAARQWCGARESSDWLGPLYQLANRLAHLYFLRERLKSPAWLVNLYFTGDPFRPTTREEWDRELRSVKQSLGLAGEVSGAIDLFLPALSPAATAATVPAPVLLSPPVIHAADDLESESFAGWRHRWTVLAEYASNQIPNAQARIDRLTNLWREPIPENWQRGIDPQLLDARYRRGDLHRPHAGEHAIEHRILLEDFDRVTCLGNRLIDGVNAFPLSRDPRGVGRRGNVEADMLLLGELAGAHRLFLCEVKHDANDPWYAAVELLRQMRLFSANLNSRNLFTHRVSILGLPTDIPFTGLIVAPASYYASRGKAQNALQPAIDLLARFASEFGVDMRLAVWDATNKTIDELPCA